MKPEIIKKCPHPLLDKDEEIMIYKFPWQSVPRFSVLIPDNKFPSAYAHRMCEHFGKLNWEADVNEIKG